MLHANYVSIKLEKIKLNKWQLDKSFYQENNVTGKPQILEN